MAVAFQITYSPEAANALRAMRGFDRAKIVQAVELHLSHEPMRPSRSRIKRMRQPFWCQFRLRVDAYRVYYNVNEAARRVGVLRILEKGSGSTPTESP